MLPALSNVRASGLKGQYSFGELNAFQALTARFARTTDILTRKVLKLLPRIMKEEAPFFIDQANFAEKLGLVKDAEALKDLRQLRNTIANEYVISDIRQIFKEVLDASPALINITNSTIVFIKYRKYLR